MKTDNTTDFFDSEQSFIIAEVGQNHQGDVELAR